MNNDSPKYQGWRRRMVERLSERGITDKVVLQVMEKVPRHWFVSDTLLDNFIYDIDQSVVIDCGQTISKPYTVAWQSQLLSLQPKMVVLEVGTGSGYQTAILCEMGGKVYTVERQHALYVKTKELLRTLNYRAKCFLGDSFNGVPEVADIVYDRILVTCGAPEIPTRLMQQLKVGGIMVVPVGEGEQRMLRIYKEGEEPNSWRIEDHGDAKFVPMLQGRNF
ncbi:MAG: protein-L-isoaspartate O-methyltransferase [Bacteroidales bacterium]|nr:protein-L-isoaspartate O-methyltransferase [Bacteroidales bacterium]